MHWWNHSDAGTDLWKLHSSTVALSFPKENEGVSFLRLSELVVAASGEHKKTNKHVISENVIKFFTAVKKKVQLSLFLMRFVLRGSEKNDVMMVFFPKPLPGWGLSNPSLRIFTSSGLFAVSTVTRVWHHLNARVTLLTHALYIWLVCAALNHLQMKIWDEAKMTITRHYAKDNGTVYYRNPEVTKKNAITAVKKKKWVTVSLLGLQSPEQRLHLSSWFCSVVKLPAGQGAHSVQVFWYSPSTAESKHMKSARPDERCFAR